MLSKRRQRSRLRPPANMHRSLSTWNGHRWRRGESHVRRRDCNIQYVPVPSGESKVSLFFVRPFARPEGYIASADGVVESGKRIGRLGLLLLLRVILDAVGPSELGEIRPECLLGRRLVGCHRLLVFGAMGLNDRFASVPRSSVDPQREQMMGHVTHRKLNEDRASRVP